MTGPTPTYHDALLDLGRALVAIHAYMDKVVLCGGWVPFFYRHMSGVSTLRQKPTLTLDLDVATPASLAVEQTSPTSSRRRPCGSI